MGVFQFYFSHLMVSHVTLNMNYFTFLGLSFLVCENGENIYTIYRLLPGLNKTIHAKCLAQG